MSYRCGIDKSLEALTGIEAGPPRIMCDRCGFKLLARTKSGGPPRWLIDEERAPGWQLILRESGVEGVRFRTDYCPRCKDA